MHHMERLTDQIILLLLCAANCVLTETGIFSIVGFLCALVLVCGFEFAYTSANVNMRRLGTVLLVAFCGASLFAPALLLFMPSAVYCCLYERQWVFRFMWVIPLVINTFLGAVSLLLFVVTLLLCGIAVLLAVRTIRSVSEFNGMRFAYDDLRQRNLELSEELAQCAVSEKRRDGEPELAYDGARKAGEANDRQAPFSQLSQRELAVVRLVAEGMDNHEIASTLYLSEGTVRNHVSTILSKMGLSNRTQIAVLYYRGK